MPWLVLIHIGEGNVTTGSLINDRYVLTAATPLYGFRARDVKVSLGAENVCLGDISTLNISVAEVYLHPLYDTDFLESDLSLVRLASPIIFTSKIRPVCLPLTDGESYVGHVSTAASWAPSVEAVSGDASSQACRATRLPLAVLQQSDCFRSNVSARLITKDKGCAGTPGAPALVCQGDAGGPLLFRNAQGIYEQIGILATANECESTIGPSLYTLVTSYLRWIVDNTRDACFCFPY